LFFNLYMTPLQKSTILKADNFAISTGRVSFSESISMLERLGKTWLYTYGIPDLFFNAMVSMEA